MGKDKKSKKDRKDKKSKKDRRDKDKRKSSKRRDESSSSSESGSDSDADQHRRVDKLATKVAAHLQRTGAASGAPTFVWTKKIEKELQTGKSVRDIAAEQARTSQAERLEEIEKVRKRQAEREEEKARREEELSLIQRLRAAQEAMESEAKEEEFYLKALVNKATKRFEEGRPAPIDQIAKNLHLADQHGCDMVEPWSYFEGLQLPEVRELHQGIQDYQEYDKYEDLHSQFWKALRVVADAELDAATKRDAADRAALLRSRAGPGAAAAEAEGGEEERSGLHSDVEVQIENMLSGQSHASLVSMEGDVERALAGGLGDPEYWEAVLKRLQVHKAKAQVRELQAALMQRHISAEIIKREQAREERRKQALAEGRDPDELELDDSGEGSSSGGEEEEGERAGRGEGERDKDKDEDGEDSDPGFDPHICDGRYSPPPVAPAEVVGKDVVNEDDDYRAISLLRQQVKLQAANAFKAAAALASVPGAANATAAERAYQALLARGGVLGPGHPMLQNLAADPLDAAGPSGSGFEPFRPGSHFRSQAEADEAALTTFRAQAEKTMGQDEGDRAFTGEVSLDSKVYWWHEKYKPRKPKYFNRVHTGYEWNKYNQTHYDSDNPPPKVVQGYKFNIMYFDLIDKSKAPTYRVAPDPASTDGSTCIIIFSAGPPYEDIAFRIVNKEWEYSHKRGFKCTFDRGILHVYFNFKRTRYRR